MSDRDPDKRTAWERFNDGDISYPTYKALAADEEYERRFGDD